MSHSSSLPTPLSERSLVQYSRPKPNQAAADAIPLLVDDTYHVFHLTTPPNTVHHPPRLRSCWSRMRSTDLVTWTRDETPIITPGEASTDPDSSGAWTGAAVLDLDGKMNIFYTGYSLHQQGKQVILRVASGDRCGTKFPQDNRHPIDIKTMTGVSAFEDIDFRDPYVFFNDIEQMYWMLIATRTRDGPYWTRGCIALLTSPDLEQWTMRAEPLYEPSDMFCPECPELFPLPNGKWYLVYSRFSAPNAGTVYRIADSPYGPFRIPRDGSHGRLDGRRWYAAKSCPKAGDPSKRVYFGWIADRCEEDGRWLWGGDLGIPREVSADNDGNLFVEPASEVLDMFRQTARTSRSAEPSAIHLTSIGSTSVLFPEQNLGGHQKSDIVLSIDVKNYDAASFGVVFNADSDLKAHRLKFSKIGGLWTVVLLTDWIPLDDFWADQYKLHIPRGVDGPEIVRHEGVMLDGPTRLIVRGTLLECFVGGRSVSFRLPEPDLYASIPVDGELVHGNGSVQGLKRFGFFVEDGTVELDVLMEMGGVFCKCVEALC